MVRTDHKLESTSIVRGCEATPDEAKQILRSRALSLSRELETKQTDEDFLEVLEFTLAYETYAIETAYIREVYSLKSFTALPCTPQFVLGLVNVRGQILAVIDIKKFFGLPGKGLTELNKIIILKNDRMEFGILADTIRGVRSLPDGKIQPPSVIMSVIKEKYLKGVTDERVVVLDAVRLLSDTDIVINEEVPTL